MAFHVYPVLASQAPAIISNAVGWAQDSGGALLNTEWGGTTEMSTLQSESTALDSALVPWIFWAYYNELVGATNATGVVASLDAGPTDASLNPVTVAALVQPYPLIVAGTPTSLDVDPTMSTMSFTYSTARVGGGSFPAGTVTTFEAPALTYPAGYSVTVTGGTVTSAPCAALLTVASNGAASVSVTIAPGTSDSCK
jgi:endoglycosylceramidase